MVNKLIYYDSNGYRIKAYYEYYVNGDFRTALQFCEKGLNVIDSFPIKGQAKMEKKLLHSLKDEIRKSTTLWAS